MKVRTSTCEWCEKTYAIKDSTTTDTCDRNDFCSEECCSESWAAYKSSGKILTTLFNTWESNMANYVPDDDEANPVTTEGSIAYTRNYVNNGAGKSPCTRREYFYLLDRYTKWKRCRNWKKSFWRWDSWVESTWDPPVDAKVAIPSRGKSNESSSDGESHDDSEGGWGAAAGGLVVLCGAAWLIWKIIKTVWNWLF